jgi:hypothetical protein
VKQREEDQRDCAVKGPLVLTGDRLLLNNLQDSSLDKGVSLALSVAVPKGLLIVFLVSRV